MARRADYILQGLQNFLKTDLISYFMIQEEGERIYVAFGKRAFFLVDFNPPDPNDPPIKEKVGVSLPLLLHTDEFIHVAVLLCLGGGRYRRHERCNSAYDSLQGRAGVCYPSCYASRPLTGYPLLRCPCTLTARSERRCWMSYTCFGRQISCIGNGRSGISFPGYRRTLTRFPSQGLRISFEIRSGSPP